MSNFELIKQNFMDPAIENLREQLEKLKSARPLIPLFDAAKELNSNEAELLSFRLGKGTVLLRPDFAEILEKIRLLGEVWILCRNEDCILEIKSRLPKPQWTGEGLLNLEGEDFEFHFSTESWKAVFSVESGEERSVEFFDLQGQAILKILLSDAADKEKFKELTDEFKAENQTLAPATERPASEKEETAVDWEALGAAWKDLSEFSDFEKLLQQFQVRRLEALRHAPDKNFARKIKTKKVAKALMEAAKEDIELNIAIPAGRHTQFRTGFIKNILWHGSWINISEESFRLHFNTWNLAETWIVRIPTDYGMISSLEAYDREGNLMVQFLSKRKDGRTELEKWRKLMFYFEQ